MLIALFSICAFSQVTPTFKLIKASGLPKLIADIRAIDQTHVLVVGIDSDTSRVFELLDVNIETHAVRFLWRDTVSQSDSAPYFVRTLDVTPSGKIIVGYGDILALIDGLNSIRYDACLDKLSSVEQIVYSDDSKLTMWTLREADTVINELWKWYHLEHWTPSTCETDVTLKDARGNVTCLAPLEMPTSRFVLGYSDRVDSPYSFFQTETREPVTINTSLNIDNYNPIGLWEKEYGWLALFENAVRGVESIVVRMNGQFTVIDTIGIGHGISQPTSWKCTGDVVSVSMSWGAYVSVTHAVDRWNVFLSAQEIARDLDLKPFLALPIVDYAQGTIYIASTEGLIVASVDSTTDVENTHSSSNVTIESISKPNESELYYYDVLGRVTRTIDVSGLPRSLPVKKLNAVLPTGVYFLCGSLGCIPIMID